jgi:hypothetical protein
VAGRLEAGGFRHNLVNVGASSSTPSRRAAKKKSGLIGPAWAEDPEPTVKGSRGRPAPPSARPGASESAFRRDRSAEAEWGAGTPLMTPAVADVPMGAGLSPGTSGSPAPMPGDSLMAPCELATGGSWIASFTEVSGWAVLETAGWSNEDPAPAGAGTGAASGACCET